MRWRLRACLSSGVTLSGLNSLSGGNQFFGQAPAPQTFFSSFQDPFAAGGAFAPAISNALGILGFGTGSASPFGFGSTFLSNSDPVFSGGFPASVASADSVRASWRRRSLVQTRAGNVLLPGPALRPSPRWNLAILRWLSTNWTVLYTDESLLTLRAEFNANQLLFLYNDPVHNYLSYELNSLLQQIVSHETLRIQLPLPSPSRSLPIPFLRTTTRSWRVATASGSLLPR